MKDVLIIILLFTSTALFAQKQDTLDDYIARQFIHQDFETLREIGQSNDKINLSSLSLYYIGLSYFANQQDSTAASFFDASIAEYPHNSNVYYYRGLTFLYAEMMNEAIRYFKAAAKLAPREADYYEAMAEAYYFKHDLDSTKKMLLLAIEQENTRGDVFLKLADVYMDQGKADSAINVYYDCLYEADPDSRHYESCLYNIAYFEYENENYSEAEMALNTLLSKNPNDFEAMEKLMQVFFATGKFSEIRNLRLDLYKAYMENELPESMATMFCFDQFEMEGMQVKACEYFAEPQVERFYKHVFFVTDEERNILFTIQTEQTAQVTEEGKAYILTMIKDGEKSIFMDFMYDKVLDYRDLKSAISKIMKGKESPDRVYNIPEEEKLNY